MALRGFNPTHPLMTALPARAFTDWDIGGDRNRTTALPFSAEPMSSQLAEIGSL